MSRLTPLLFAALQAAPAFAAAPAGPAVGPQYDTTHVYVAPDQVDRFVQSFDRSSPLHRRKPPNWVVGMGIVSEHVVKRWYAGPTQTTLRACR